MAGLWHDRMMSLEVREWFGGRATLLSYLVQARPGACDVYRAPMANPLTALAAMQDRTGRPYPWSHLLHIAHRRLMPWIDHTLPMPDLDTPLVCSEAVGFALEVAGVNLPRKVRELAPGDLTKVAEYRFTLGM
jgi:hypothetical protein